MVVVLKAGESTLGGGLRYAPEAQPSLVGTRLGSALPSLVPFSIHAPSDVLPENN